MDLEYTEVNNNLRHYSSLRFAQMTIFLAISGALASTFLEKNESLNPIIKFCIEIGGVFLTVMFWIMEESATKKWRAFHTRAINLEKDSNNKQWTNFPQSELFSATNATRMIFWEHLFFG